MTPKRTTARRASRTSHADGIASGQSQERKAIRVDYSDSMYIEQPRGHNRFVVELERGAVSTDDPPHAAHHVSGQNWAEMISELVNRGFDAGTLQHALRLAAVYVQEYDPDTDDADEQRIIAWEKAHRLPFSYRDVLHPGYDESSTDANSE